MGDQNAPERWTIQGSYREHRNLPVAGRLLAACERVEVVEAEAYDRAIAERDEARADVNLGVSLVRALRAEAGALGDEVLRLRAALAEGEQPTGDELHDYEPSALAVERVAKLLHEQEANAKPWDDCVEVTREYQRERARGVLTAGYLAGEWRKHPSEANPEATARKEAADLRRRIRARLNLIESGGYSVVEMAYDLERLANHPMWLQAEDRAVADEAAGEDSTTETEDSMAPLGWCCEKHPEQGWPHGDCAGPGRPMTRDDIAGCLDEAITSASDGYVKTDGALIRRVMDELDLAGLRIARAPAVAPSTTETGDDAEFERLLDLAMGAVDGECWVGRDHVSGEPERFDLRETFAYGLRAVRASTTETATGDDDERFAKHLRAAEADHAEAVRLFRAGWNEMTALLYRCARLEREAVDAVLPAEGERRDRMEATLPNAIPGLTDTGARLVYDALRSAAAPATPEGMLPPRLGGLGPRATPEGTDA